MKEKVKRWGKRLGKLLDPGISDLVADVNELKELIRAKKNPTIETELEPGEHILKVMVGGRGVPGVREIALGVSAVGIWGLTNQRLIYEPVGKHGLTESYYLKDLVNLEMAEAGRMTTTKYLIATFMDEHTEARVRVCGSDLEDFKGKTQKAAQIARAKST